MSYFDTLIGSHTIDFNNLQGLKLKWKLDDEARRKPVIFQQKLVADEKQLRKYYNSDKYKNTLQRKSEKDFVMPMFCGKEVTVYQNPELEIEEPETFHCAWCGVQGATKHDHDGFNFCGGDCIAIFKKSITSGLNNDLDCFKRD